MRETNHLTLVDLGYDVLEFAGRSGEAIERVVFGHAVDPFALR
jgi:hypothetical protein